MKFTIAVLVGLIAATEAIPSGLISDAAKMGPTAVLGIVLLIIVLKVLPTKDRLFADVAKEISERQHADSKELNKTMSELRITLAKK